MLAHVDQLQVQLLCFHSCFVFRGVFIREFNCAGSLSNLGQINQEFVVMLKTDSILDFLFPGDLDVPQPASQQRYWGLIGIFNELLEGVSKAGLAHTLVS